MLPLGHSEKVDSRIGCRLLSYDKTGFLEVAKAYHARAQRIRTMPVELSAPRK
jgi:hypothetical protein